MQSFLNGVATALVTPFTKDNKLDFEVFAQLIEFQLQNGIDALVILGTTGEPATLTEKEKIALIEFAHRQIDGRCKLIVGTGNNDTARTVDESFMAKSLGADGLLIVTPYYNKCTQAGLIAHYSTIASKVNLPIICYNVPSRTGMHILPNTMEKLADIPQIVGIKESSGNMQTIGQMARQIRGKCQLYSGDDFLNIPLLAIGASGLISVSANLLPKQTKELYTLMQNEQLQKANSLQESMLPIIDMLFSEVNPIPIKAAMQLLGFAVGKPRLPLTPLEDVHLQKLQVAMQKFGLKIKGSVL